MSETPSLAGKHALITGGSSGMGEEIARQMAAAGAKVTLVGRNEKRLDAVAEGIGSGAFAIARDISEDRAGEEIAAAAQERHGPVSILANVAGIMELGPIEETTADSLDRQYRTNVRAPFLLTKAMSCSSATLWSP